MSKKDYSDRIEENIDIREVAEYLYEHYVYFFTNLDMTDAKRCAKYLIDTCSYTKDEIISGKFDMPIEKYLTFYETTEILKENSIAKTEEQKEIEFKTRERQERRSRIISIVMSLVIAATTFYSVYAFKKGVDKQQLKNEYDYAISVRAGYDGSSDIVSINEYSFTNTNTNERVTAVNNEDLAADILRVCSDDPSLLDVTLLSTYDNIDYDKLNNMDTVLYHLKSLISKKSSDLEEKSIYIDDSILELISIQLEDCDYFVDYLSKTGKIDIDDKDYHGILKSIQEYKNLKNEGKSFSDLSPESKKLLEKLMNDYVDNMAIYEAMRNKMLQIPNDEFGARGSGSRS